MVRARENEAKKTLEVELQMARAEREGLLKAQKDYELRSKELEAHRARLDREHVEAIERYKSEVNRTFADQDFDLHRRRLQLEEDEQRVRLERDRIAQVSSCNETMSKDLVTLKSEHGRLLKENESLFKENRDLKD